MARLATSGALEVRLAETEAEVEAAQQLRYRVFYEEMSAVPSPQMRAEGRDFDRFDDFCDHLLVVDRDVLDEDGQPAVVGTYRFMRSEAGGNGRRLLHRRRIRHRADAGAPAAPARARSSSAAPASSRPIAPSRRRCSSVARRDALCGALLHRSDVRLRLAAGHRSRCAWRCRCPICIISTACRRKSACARGPSSMSR